MRRKDRGSMLVMALWALTLLVLFSISLGMGVRQKAGLLSRLSTLDAVYPIAYSGVEQAKSLVKSDSNTDVDLLGDAWASGERKISMNGGSFSLRTDGKYSVVDEERKLNLNTTSVKITARLLELVSGLNKDAADELAYNLLDWVDSDPFFGHPQYGAEDNYYTNLNKPYASKDTPYEVLDELLLVKGMTPEIFQKIRPYITVYGSGQVNLNTASREVLQALGFSEDGVDILMKYRAGSDGVEGNSDDGYFTAVANIALAVQAQGGKPFDAGQAAVLSGLVDANLAGIVSTTFSATSIGELSSGVSVEVDSVFNRKGVVLYQRAGEVQWPPRA